MTQPPPYYAPPPRPQKGNGTLVAVIFVVMALMLIVAVAMAWFLTVSGRDATGGLSESKSQSASPTDHRVPTGDGEPATEVRIESLRLSQPPSSKKGTKKCEYSPSPEEQMAAEREDVGSPKDGKRPDSGTQDMSITTNHGELVVTVDNEKAPCTAASYEFLAGLKYFDDSTCHRLTTEDLYILQCGDPSGTGRGGPTYRFGDEYVPKDTGKDLSEKEQEAGERPEPNYRAGDVAMANSGEDTNGSQFFIVYKDTYLPPDYTVFGELTTGLDIVEGIADDGALLPPP